MAREEVREGESAGSPGGTMAPDVGADGEHRHGALSPVTRRRKIGGRECDDIKHAESTLAYHVGAKQPS